MESYRSQKITKDRIRKRFGSHSCLYSKYTPQIPQTAEREYVRLCDSYMGILKQELEESLPKLKEAYKTNRDEDTKSGMRHDGYADLLLLVSRLFNQMQHNITAKIFGFGLRKRLENMAHLTRKLTIKEWKKAIKATLGIDIREDYYSGEFFDQMLEEWVKENVDLIQTIPENTLDKMREIVYDGYTKGKTTTRMVKEIQRAYQISRRHAELIARDQTAKLNGQIQQAQQEDAGITEYIWCTTGDERVRSSHKELNGKKFKWSDAPLNSDGRKCHPGEDYQCRCIARPVFDEETLNLPIEDTEVKS